MANGPYDRVCSDGFSLRQRVRERITVWDGNPCDRYTPEGTRRAVEAEPPGEPGFACDGPVGFVEGYGEGDWTCVPADDTADTGWAESVPRQTR